MVGETLRGLITAMHARHPRAATLTAGLDSRMVLAAASRNPTPILCLLADVLGK